MKQLFKFILIPIIGIMTLLSSCEKEQEIKVLNVKLTETSLNLVEGETKVLEATITPEDALNKAIRWESSLPEIATVNQEGMVTAIKKGDAVIKVITEDGAKEALCLVKVSEKKYPVESVSLNKTSAEIEEGTTLQLQATVNPEKASNKNIKWSSSNKDIATIDANGLVIALIPGKTKIIVTTEDGNKTAECNLTVIVKQIPVTSVVLDKTNTEIQAGATIQLIPTIMPENATNKNILWKSSNESIATVNAEGIVNAKAEGDVKITATTEDGGKTAECSIKVLPEGEKMPDYIDKDGVNQGKGVKIGEQIWAPVNCGYHKDNFPYGKYFQWGRKDGFGYQGEQEITTSSTNPESLDKADPNIYYTAWQNNIAPDGTWGTQAPWDIKNEVNDPCPEGWRVPTKEEMNTLIQNRSQWVTKDGQNGYWFSGELEYSEAGGAQIFLPAGGSIKGLSKGRNIGGYYFTSTPIKEKYSAYYYFNDNSVSGSDFFRYCAYQVRCISDKK